ALGRAHAVHLQEAHVLRTRRQPLVGPAGGAASPGRSGTPHERPGGQPGPGREHHHAAGGPARGRRPGRARYARRPPLRDGRPDRPGTPDGRAGQEGTAPVPHGDPRAPAAQGAGGAGAAVRPGGGGAPSPGSRAVVTRKQIMLVFYGVMLGMFLAALDQTIVATALPRIVTDLQGFEHMSWVVTAYLLASTVSVPLYGKLSDLFGRRKLFIFSIVLFLAGSALSGLSQNMSQLILFRGIQGLGAGGILPVAITIIGDLFSPRERGRYQGYTGAVFAMSSIIGPLLGGYLTDQVSWRWIFYINLPVGAVALFVIATTMHIPFHRREHRIDYVGAGLLAAAATSLMMVAVWGGTTYAWASPEIVGLGAAGV